ncbi:MULTISPECIES: NtaA/DmoA family FMN-dependent monooxygenase [Sphingobium]|uniref:NtaA/DmoA family FMN-dependent monooxygenase n=1 Tax=Sphingobium TaxID=165695 RepID=UPI00159C5267|nr:NtaA/DmoA family FMN-dependent monooxygenase [Sphingobium sp. 15-1]
MILLWMPEYLGSHSGAWRREGPPHRQEMDFDLVRQQLQTAERGKLHGAFFTDTLAVGYYNIPVTMEALSVTAKGSRWEPVTLMAALAACTRHIGLLGTVSSVYSEPYNVARMFASLDHISGGRAGWHADSASHARASLNFGDSTNGWGRDADERGLEFLDVVTDLWDSWEDDAFVRDRVAGRYFDPGKLHGLNHRGKHLSVAGPLNIARPPQGHPVIVRTGASMDDGTVRKADLICPWHAGIAPAKAFYDEIKGKAVDNGRDPEHLKILPAMVLSLGRSRAHAEEKLARLDDLINPVLGMELLQGALQADLSCYPIDGPVPEIEDQSPPTAAQRYYLDIARRDKLTIRQLMQNVARVSVTPGSADDIADMLQEWMEAGAADGFGITFADDADSLNIFVDEVVPELQRRGLFQTDYRGGNLRENLGLPRPSNRYLTGT